MKTRIVFVWIHFVPFLFDHQVITVLIKPERNDFCVFTAVVGFTGSSEERPWG